MTRIKDLYLAHVGQTSDMPMLLEVSHAQGVYIYDTGGKRYIDMNSGIAVSSLGHCHPAVVKAIQNQAATYMHTMVYGEHVQSPQVEFAEMLLGAMQGSYDCVYYLSAGTEATELGIKLAKKHTGRHEVVAMKNSYHGSTLGAESLRSDLSYTSAFMPVMPGVTHISFNDLSALDQITSRTAGVICEVVKGEEGVITGDSTYFHHLRKRCDEVGAVLIFDEIQSGFGRTGKLFAQERYEVYADVVLIGKAMGGGMPISGVVTNQEILGAIIRDPALGHISTFGGHPVCCAAAAAGLKVLLTSGLIQEVEEKEQMIVDKLSQHPIVKEVRSEGLMMAVEPIKRKYLKHIVSKALELGVIVDWFLFNNRSFRLAPPLISSKDELAEGCDLLLQAMDYAQDVYA